MKLMKNKVAELIENISMKVAEYACDSASILGGHQLEEPEEFKDMEELKKIFQ